MNNPQISVLLSCANQACFLAEPARPTKASTLIQEAASRACEAERAVQQYCSFPDVRSHPRRHAMEAKSQLWLANLYHGRLPAARVQRLLDTRLDTLGCVIYPSGLWDDRSFTLIKLTHWFFVLDDIVDDPHLLGYNYKAACHYVCRLFKAMFSGDMGAMVAVGLTNGDAAGDINSDMEQQITGGIAAESTATSVVQAKAQQEIVIEMGMQWANEMRDLGMSTRQLERLREAVAEYLAGIVGVVRCRQEKRLPSLEEYTCLRRMDFGMHLYLLGIEFDLGIELSDETLAHPLMKKLHETTTDQMMWINDLLSFKRELHNEDYVSLLPVLHFNVKKDADVQRSCKEDQEASAKDLQQTICQARALIKAVDKERVQLVAEIAAWKPNNHQLQAYVQATHWTMSGVTFWTLWSSRYQRTDPI